MKQVSLLTLVMLVTLNLNAASKKWGSQCGLTDSNETEEWKEIGKGLSLTKASPAKINQLPTLTKQQLIITAKYFASNDGGVVINNTVDAVEYLRSNDGLHVNNYRVRNALVTQVMTYPGENPYSVIFRAGTKHIIAYGQDGSVLCK